MPLVPNSPIKRLQYVIGQYDGTRNERVLPDVVDVSLRLMGRDSVANDLVLRRPLAFLFWRGFPPRARGPLNRDKEVESLVERLDREVPSQHAHDFLIPWIAKELGRLNKAVQRYLKAVPPGGMWSARVLRRRSAA